MHIKVAKKAKVWVDNHSSHIVALCYIMDVHILRISSLSSRFILVCKTLIARVFIVVQIVGLGPHGDKNSIIWGNIHIVDISISSVVIVCQTYACHLRYGLFGAMCPVRWAWKQTVEIPSLENKIICDLKCFGDRLGWLKRAPPPPSQ